MEQLLRENKMIDDNIKEDYPELEGLEKFWNDENDTPENMRGYKKPRPKK